VTRDDRMTIVALPPIPVGRPRRHRRAARTFATAAALAVAATAGAQAPGPFPTKPIRWIVPFAAGAGTDLTSRTVALRLAEALGQSVVIDNRAGAAGNIGAELAARSPADGYTLVTLSTTHAVNPSVNRRLAYQLDRDFAGLTQMTAQPYALVTHPSVAANSVRELVALARARPGQILYGSSGTGGFSHLAGALFGQSAGIALTHVPYKGGGPALTDVLGGQIHLLFSTLLQGQPHMRTGKLRALAVTSARRAPAMPDLPTMVEAGVPGYAISGWYGVAAPAGTPVPVLERLNREMVRILASADVRDKLSADGSLPVGSSPAEFSAHIRSEVARWSRVVQVAGIRSDGS
jgi:tripartite-type tricarboxylate transporter receptor subunit TctC